MSQDVSFSVDPNIMEKIPFWSRNVICGLSEVLPFQTIIQELQTKERGVVCYGGRAQPTALRQAGSLEGNILVCGLTIFNHWPCIAAKPSVGLAIIHTVSK